MEVFATSRGGRRALTIAICLRQIVYLVQAYRCDQVSQGGENTVRSSENEERHGGTERRGSLDPTSVVDIEDGLDLSDECP